MAISFVIIPPVNTIRFVEMGKTLPDAYTQARFDDLWMHESLLPFQNDYRYKAKTQYFDYNWAQFHHNGTHGFDVFILNCKGEAITTVPIFKTNNAFAGNVWDAHGTITPVALNTAVFRVHWNSVDLLDGETYFIKFEVYYSADKAKKVSYISEPIEFRTKQEDTVIIDYTNKYNQHGIFWTFINSVTPAASWNMVMRLRIEGYVEDFTPDSSDTFYEDQVIDLTLLNALPYRKFKLFAPNISDYHIDKLNRIFACDNISINAKKYVKDDGAKLEIGRTTQESLKQCELEIREYRTIDSSLFQSTYDDGVITGPGDTGGSGSGFITMSMPSGRMVELTIPRIFTDDTSWTAYAGLLTSIVKGEDGVDFTYPFGLYGEFEYTVEDKLRYLADVNDAYLPSFKMNMFTNSFDITVVVAGQASDVTYQFTGGSHIVFYDSVNPSIINYSAQGNSLQSVVKNLGVGTHTITIYHDNSGMDAFAIPNQTPNVTAIADGMPLTVSSVLIDGSDIQQLSMASFDAIKGKLNSITVKNSNVEEINVTALDVQTWIGGIGLVDFSGNKLPDTEIDAFINSFVEDVLFVGGGTMDFSGQTPAVEPTIASEDARNALINFGWDLIFDVL